MISDSDPNVFSEIKFLRGNLKIFWENSINYIIRVSSGLILTEKYHAAYLIYIPLQEPKRKKGYGSVILLFGL